MTIKRTILTFLTSLIVFISFQLNAQPFIHLHQGQLRDENNAPIKLNGINLGGWLLWEGWIWGGGFTSEKTIFKRIEQKTNQKFASTFRDSIYRDFISKKDIEKISTLNFNCLRIPFNHDILDNQDVHHPITSMDFTILDSVISWCKYYNIFVILDMHALPGGQNNLFISDPDQSKLWGNIENLNQSVKLWFEIAKRYQNNKSIAGYDLINEPNAPKGIELVELYQRMIDTIRRVDKNHLIILEGNNFAHSFDCFNKILDSNQIYSFHFYPWLSNNKGKINKLKRYNEFTQKVKTPLWCGEWGEDNVENLEEIKNILNDSTYNFCGNAFWTWKKVTSNNHLALNAISVSEDWRNILNDKNIPVGKTYEQIINEFLTAIKIDNTSQNYQILNLFLKAKNP